MYVPLCIGTIDDVDKNVGILEIIPPIGTNLPLSTNIPHIQLEALGIDALNIETWFRGK